MSADSSDTPKRYSSAENRLSFAALRKHNALIRSLVSRDLKVKYQRSVLGLVWTLLNPVIMLAVLITVFSFVIRIQLVNYWAFLISGFFVWSFIHQALIHSASILRNNAALRRGVTFPGEVLLLSALLAKLIEFLIEIFVVLLVLFVFHHQAIPSSVLLFPYLVLLQVMLTLGLMFPLSVLSVLFYDVQHALPLVIITLFYLSPVFYPLSMVPEAAFPFYFLNPFAGLLTLFHQTLYEGVWPPLSLLGWVSATALATLILGFVIFKRAESICVETA